MDVIIDDKDTVSIDEKSMKIGSGQDGHLYLHLDTIIKICTSQYMTYEKLDDFNRVKMLSAAKGINTSKSTIILPDKKVEKQNEQVKRLKITPIFGYTQVYKLEKKSGISTLKTSTFIENVEKVHEDLHAIFSSNNIAIMDTNPHNLLVTNDDEIYFIDHDRNVTPSCMSSEKDAVIDNDYYKHNEVRFSKLLNRALLLQAFRGIQNNDQNIRLVLEAMEEEELKNYSINQLYSIISDYDTIYEYSVDKAKELCIKK
jgi:hypothetical protein